MNIVSMVKTGVVFFLAASARAYDKADLGDGELAVIRCLGKVSRSHGCTTKEKLKTDLCKANFQRCLKDNPSAVNSAENLAATLKAVGLMSKLEKLKKSVETVTKQPTLSTQDPAVFTERLKRSAEKMKEIQASIDNIQDNIDDTQRPPPKAGL